MTNFIKKVSDQTNQSGCCGAENKEVEQPTKQQDSCCGTSSSNNDSCCG